MVTAQRSKHIRCFGFIAVSIKINSMLIPMSPTIDFNSMKEKKEFIKAANRQALYLSDQNPTERYIVSVIFTES